MRGISVRTTSLGWTSIRLHYSADGDKDPSTPQGRKWYEEARRGMSDARFRKEYEVDYGALGGQLVFPEFDESIHVVGPRPSILDARFVTCWLGCDPHPRTPHAMVWMLVDKYDDLHIVNSWWPDPIGDDYRDESGEKKPRLLIKDYAAEIKRIGEGNPVLKPRRLVMDQAGANFNADEQHNFFDEYQKEGIYFQPAKKNIGYAGYELIHKALAREPVEVAGKIVQLPRLTIWAGCGDADKLVWQFKNLRYREWKGNVTDKDAPQDPMDKDRHLIDTVSYILLDNPHWIEPVRKGGGDDYKPIYGGGKIPGGTGY